MCQCQLKLKATCPHCCWFNLRLNQVMVSFLNFWESSTTSLINQCPIKQTCSNICLYMFSHCVQRGHLVCLTGAHSLQRMCCEFLYVCMYSMTSMLHLTTPLLLLKQLLVQRRALSHPLVHIQGEYCYWRTHSMTPKHFAAVLCRCSLKICRKYLILYFLYSKITCPNEALS